jgi:hypothetical protein
LGTHVGIDVGQRNDPTACVVATVRYRPRNDGKGLETEFLIRHLERLGLGTPYPAVVEHVASLVGQVNAKLAEDAAERGSPETPWLVVDATGVGTPVCDELRKELAGQRVQITEAVFSAGEKLDVNPRVRRVTVAKMGMVARLQTLLAWRRIRLPRTAMARELAEELKSFEIRAAGTSETAGAFRVGSHDDLVVALGLATLEGARSVYEDRGLFYV